jgi:hypothetical protein
LQDTVRLTALERAFGVVVVLVVVVVVVVDVAVVEVVAVESPPWPLALCVRLARPSAVATPADATAALRSERPNRCT